MMIKHVNQMINVMDAGDVEDFARFKFFCNQYKFENNLYVLIKNSED